MTKELFHYYKENLIFYSQVTKENKVISNLIIVSGLSLFCFIWYYLIIIKNEYYCVLIEVVIVVVTYLLLSWLNGKTIKRKFPEMYISPLNWDSNKFNDLFIQRLTEKIENLSEENIELLQKQIKENGDKEKISFVTMFSIFGVLFIPLWDTYLSKLFDAFKSDIKVMTINFILIIFLIFLLSFFVIL